MFKIKFDIPNSIDIGAVVRWIYTGAVDLHRDGGAVDLHRGGGRWIYIGAVGGGFTKCRLIVKSLSYSLDNIICLIKSI